MQDSLDGEGFGDHPDLETAYAGAADDQVHPWQLFLVDLGGSCGSVRGELAGLQEGACFAPRPTHTELAASLAGSVGSPAPWRFGCGR